MADSMYVRMSDAVPGWYKTLSEQYQAGRNQFILDFNVRDLVFPTSAAPDAWPQWMPTSKETGPGPGYRLADPDLPLPLPNVSEWLCQRWLARFDVVLTFSVSRGLRLYQPPGRLVQLAWGEPSSSTFVPEEPQAQEVMFRGEARGQVESGKLLGRHLFAELARLALDVEPKLADQLIGEQQHRAEAHFQSTLLLRPLVLFLDRLLTTRFTVPGKKEDTSARVALLLDKLENVAPAREYKETTQTLMIESLERWATDARVVENRHLIVMLADDINQIAPELYAGGGGIHRITLPRPSRPERAAFLQWLAEGRRLPTETETFQIAAQSGPTAGLNYADLDGLARLACAGSKRPFDELLRERKAEVIRSQSRNLLEVIEPRLSWDHVGGTAVYDNGRQGSLHQIKTSLIDVAAWLREPEPSPRVPKGMLFVGPPGTGKSLVAEVLAKEGRVNMVKLRDIQGSHVGESERNMTRALEVAQAFEPVVVFIDEIDQAYGRRTGGASGDSGVGARLFGKLLEFMGNNQNRGRVIWIAASNRPDLIDSALLRRFDRVVPFLLAGPEDRLDILKNALPHIAGFQWEVEDANSPDQQAAQPAADAIFQDVVARTDQFSGSDLEKITRRALELGATAKRQPDGSTVLTLQPRWLQRALDNYRLNRNDQIYELQTLLALEATDFKDFLPDIETLNQHYVTMTTPPEIDWKEIGRKIQELQRTGGPL